MENSLRTILILLLSAFLIFKFFFASRRKLPPSAGLALPIIGHLHLLKPPVHRTFQRMSQKYGPIFSLKLGYRLVVVVSSPSLVEECFNKNDILLADRPATLTGKHIGYNDTTIVGSPYGDHWRNLRRLCAQEIFSSGRLNMFLFVRRDEVKRMLQTLYRDSRNGFAKVEMKSKLSELAFNVIMRMVAGKRFLGEDMDDEESKKFREQINEVFLAADASNPEDFFPFLRWLDLRGLEKKLEDLAKRMDVTYQWMIDEHRREGTRSTMIGHLLSLQESEPEYYTDQTIKGLVINMLTAGTDTTAATMEWALSLLLNHPDKLAKARAEVDNYVGFDHLVDEPDLSQLHYLQSIISETYRLFPAGPLLIPHQSSQSVKLGVYEIPANTMLIANAWAIHRDPLVWEDPNSFKPERFKAGQFVETQKLIPFGMGRRSCPGAALSQRVVGLTLASLIQCFEWERISEEMIDLAESKGLTMPKAQPLEAMCKPRSIMHKVL